MRIWLSALIPLLALQALDAKGIQVTVRVVPPPGQTSDTPLYQSLQKTLFNYLNGTRWAREQGSPHERIQTTFTLNLTDRPSPNEFKAQLTVQSRRPVFNSTYHSPVVALRDEAVRFRYVAFDPLVFSPNRFENNLASIMAYYAYLVIGMDADTFSLRGGTPYFEKAARVVAQARSSGRDNWSAFGGRNSRASLIDELRAPALAPLRDSLYPSFRDKWRLIKT